MKKLFGVLFGSLLLLAFSFTTARAEETPPNATPAPTASPAPTATPQVSPEEATLQKESFELSQTELEELLQDIEPVFKEKFPKTKALVTKDLRDKTTTLFTALVIEAYKEYFEPKLADSLIDLANDFASRSIKSPLGIGLANCTTFEGESGLFCGFYAEMLDETDLNLFFKAILASKGKKSKDILPTIFKKAHDLLVEDEKKYRESQGEPVTEPIQIDDEAVKTYTCLVGEGLLDAPFFRKPCRQYKPYQELIESMRKDYEELQARFDEIAQEEQEDQADETEKESQDGESAQSEENSQVKE